MKANYYLYQANIDCLFKFRDLPESKNNTVDLEADQYKPVYAGEIEYEEGDLYALERLYYIFNMEHPEDYKGHSMSVSDLVKLGDTWYYCSSFGFDKVEVQ